MDPDKSSSRNAGWFSSASKANAHAVKIRKSEKMDEDAKRSGMADVWFEREPNPQAGVLWLLRSAWTRCPSTEVWLRRQRGAELGLGVPGGKTVFRV
jgi:hypothetical protein